MNKAKIAVICLVVGCLLLTQMAYASPYFRLDKEEEWQEALYSGKISAVELSEWSDYMYQWEMHRKEGPPYPPNTFLSPQPPTGGLYVYGGGGGGGGGALDPCDAGLVMYWGDATIPAGDYASAYRFDYQLDPDLSNCIITVTVNAPGPPFRPQVNQVSFGLQNNPKPGGAIRAWYWNCGAAGSGAPIIWNTTTAITIDTSKTGVAAATPIATSYANNPGFNLRNVQWIIVDEDANWIGGIPAPTPGLGLIALWNYWYNLVVLPKAPLSKGYYIKWSQPPDNNDPNAQPPIFIGWDERSDYNYPPYPIVADDWECNDNRPITDIHWWGSFLGWNQPYPPPIIPKSFHLGIWTDVPDPNPWNPNNFSHPKKLVWENDCNCWVWNFAGYDRDPRGHNEMNDSCFQFNQLLSQNEWFQQEPNDPNDPNRPRIYWLSIAAVYNPQDYYEPNFCPWGWKTRKHFFNDDAVRITNTSPKPPKVGSIWLEGSPIRWPDPNTSWDVAFELTTNEPGPEPNEPPSADFDNNGIVNFIDFATFARQWLTAGP